MNKRMTRMAGKLGPVLLLVSSLPLAGCAIDESSKESQLQPYGGSKAYPIIVKGNQAYVANCGIWNVDASDTSTNLLYPNHGCAVQSNIAAMTAYPQDLVRPRLKRGLAPGQPRTAAAKRALSGDVNRTGSPAN